MSRNPMRSRVVLFAAVLALVAAACGGSDASDGVASLESEATDTTVADGAVAGVDVEQALIEFAACMRENGVDMEDPTVDADGNVQFGRFGGGRGQPGEAGFDREAVFAAREACAPYIEGVTLGFRGERDQEAFQDTLVEFAQCMRDNGVDVDDPDFSNFGPGGGNDGEPGGGPFGDLDRSDPTFQAAQDACGDILGGFGPGGGLRPGDE